MTRPDAGHASGGGDAAQDARQLPSPAACGIDRPDRHGQVQRFGVDRAEEERQRRERDQQHGDVSRSRSELERGEPMQQHERHRHRDQRDEHAGGDVGSQREADDSHQQRIERIEDGLGRARVAVLRDIEVVDRVPPDRRRGEHVANRSPGARSAASGRRRATTRLEWDARARRRRRRRERAAARRRRHGSAAARRRARVRRVRPEASGGRRPPGRWRSSPPSPPPDRAIAGASPARRPVAPRSGPRSSPHTASGTIQAR